MAGFRTWVRRLLREREEVPRDPSLPEPRTRPSPEEMRSFAEPHNDFACALWSQLLPRPGNVFFSPFSIRMAVA